MSNVIPFLQSVETDGNSTSTGRFPVEISFGPTSQEFEFAEGDKARSILDNGLIKEIIGFSGSESMLVNGRPITPDTFLRPGDRIEFIKEAGQKA